MSFKPLFPLTRSPISRRRFLRTTTGVALGSGFVALAGCGGEGDSLDTGPGVPKPIPTGVQPLGAGTETFHFFLPDPNVINEPATITDFNGDVGLANVDGTGTGRGSGGGPTVPLLFDVDVRFMRGEYIAADGRHHDGAFAFL